MVQDDIADVRAKYLPRLMALPNVTGVGIGKQGDEAVILVFVVKKANLDSLFPDQVVPEELEGYRVQVQEVGEVVAHPTEHRHGT